MESFLTASDFGPARRPPSRRQGPSNRNNFTTRSKPNPSTPSQSNPASSEISYEELYTPRHKANLLNFIDFLSDEIRPDNNHVELLPEFVYDASNGPVGKGSTMEVFATRWKGKEVAVKRLKRSIVPTRNNNIPIERDTTYVKARYHFYQKVQDVMQEILIMCRPPLNHHRNIIKLLAISWDDDFYSNNDGSRFYSPLLIVELACKATPTLLSYYENQFSNKTFSHTKEFIADVADGLSMLHFCSIVHDDIKPENVLLFLDHESPNGLVAKLSDFGFANVDGVVRGRSRLWAAPECLDNCPVEIFNPKKLPLCPWASDTYSFGLLLLFVLLNGQFAHKLLRLSTEEFDTYKFSMKANCGFVGLFEEYSASQEINADMESGIASLLLGTLEADPLTRINSLGGVRRLITFEEDPKSTMISSQMTRINNFEEEQRVAHFKFRPFGDIYNSMISPGNTLSRTKTPFSKYVLDALPHTIITELLSIAGETPDPHEPTIHTNRRLKLQEYAKIRNGESPVQERRFTAEELENSRMSSKMLYRLRSDVLDYMALGLPLTSIGDATISTARSTFYDLDGDERPRVFTWIDVGNEVEVLKLLQQDPSLAHSKLPKGSWTPLHFAAEVGRVDIIRLLIQDYGVDPNLRAIPTHGTPLHGAASSELQNKVETIDELLKLGADINALCYAKQSRVATPLEMAVELFLSSLGRDHEQQSKDAIALLVRRGANYLRDSQGSNIMFNVIHNIKLLKLVFDAIEPRDVGLLANVINSRGETMLHASCIQTQYEVIQYLLQLGADPTMRDCQGRTPYNILKSGSAGMSTAFSRIFAVMNWMPNRTELVLELFENIGGEATALDDFWYREEEVRTIHSNLESNPRIGQTYNPLTIARFNLLANDYLSSQSPVLMKLSHAIDREGILQALTHSLKNWDIQRRQGLISLTQLPEGYLEFLQEADGYMLGFLTERLEPDDAIEIKKVLKQYLLDLCKWLVDNNVDKVLSQLERVYLEAVVTGAFDEVWDISLELWSLAASILSDPSNFSIFTKSEAARKLKACWECINRGEILDLLFELTEMTKTTLLVEGFLDSATFEGFKQSGRLPASTIWELRLPQRYPGHQLFILSSLPIGPTIYPLFFIQLFVYLFPSIFLLTTLYLQFRCAAYNSTFWFLASQLWMDHFNQYDWVLIDRYYKIHPNIYRGLKVALEFTWFRLRNLFYIAIDPLILAVKADATGLISIPQRLKSMKKNALWPLFWLSLRPEDAFAPMPCYSAAADFARKQNDGSLPRTLPVRLWNDGWWELEAGTQKKWNRVDVNFSPPWAQYCEASKEIRSLLINEPHLYKTFLNTRDYFLKTPSEQLLAMEEIFGPNQECTAIWRRLFVDESGKGWSKFENELPGWAQTLTRKLRVDKMREAVLFMPDLVFRSSAHERNYEERVAWAHNWLVRR